MTQDRVVFFLLGLFVGTGILAYLVNEFFRDLQEHERKGQKRIMFFKCIKSFKGIAEGEIWELCSYLRGSYTVNMSRKHGAITSSVRITVEELTQNFEFTKSER